MNEPVPFLIVTAGRTGSNLLRSLIDSHPAAFCGGEIFNMEFVEKKGIPWPIGDVPKNPELLALMREQPGKYVERLFATAAAAGHRAIGAKLMYENAAAHPAAAECLAANERIRVIHLRRRNVLRQYVSLQRAFKTGAWLADSNAGPPPPVHLEFVKFVWFLLRQDELRNTAKKLFSRHATMDIMYEDLSANPIAVGTRCIEFLGLDPNAPLKTMLKKGGTDSLHEAIENYDELKAHFAEWHGFFDE